MATKPWWQLRRSGGGGGGGGSDGGARSVLCIDSHDNGQCLFLLLAVLAFHTVALSVHIAH